MKYRKYLVGAYGLDSARHALVMGYVGILQEAFIRGVLHRLIRRERIPGALLWAYIRLDPTSLWSCVPLAWSMAAKRNWGTHRVP